MATLPDVASELSRQLQQSESPTNIKRLEAAVREINSLLMDFRGDIQRLTPQEREYVLARRKPKETDASSEQKVIQEALGKGSFRASFSAVIVNQKGEHEWAGFQEFYSKGTTRENWDAYQQDSLAMIVPGAYDDHGHLDHQIADFLSGQKVLDAVAVRTEYRRKTKQVTTQSMQTTTGLMGISSSKTVETKTTEFDKNEAIFFRNTNEPAVRICYQTLTTNPFYDNARMYTDENDRPGNHLKMEMIVPLSVAQKITQEIQKNSGFCRKLVQTAVLDNELGLIGTDRRLRLANNENERKKDSYLKNSNSLPPYEDEDWQNSKMLVSVDLEVPKGDQLAQAETPTYGITKIEMAKQKLQKIIVSPKK